MPSRTSAPWPGNATSEDNLLSIVVPVPRPQRAVLHPRLPSPRRVVAFVAMLVALLVGSTLLSTFAYLRLPTPTGPLAVGRTDVLLVDLSRTESASRGGGDRAIRVVAWYPATPGAGTAASYVPNYAAIREGLVASEQLPAPVVAGLSFVQTGVRENAQVAGPGDAYPLVVLSPGNATNVAFYAALAEDLASRGYVVLGVDHPYQVAAVDVGAGRVAVYEGDTALGDADGVAARIDERVADLAFLLDRLQVDGTGLEGVVGHIDLSRVGVVGHSNGGLAAVAMCRDPRVSACLNIDGQLAGGPFSARPNPTAPDKPFMFLTKETRLHPALAALFEAAGPDTYRVVVPAATHDAFADGARFVPRMLPVDSSADGVLAVERGTVSAFFDRYLRGADDSVFRSIPAPLDLYVEVYPLNGRPNLPSG